MPPGILPRVLQVVRVAYRTLRPLRRPRTNRKARRAERRSIKANKAKCHEARLRGSPYRVKITEASAASAIVVLHPHPNCGRVLRGQTRRRSRTAFSPPHRRQVGNTSEAAAMPPKRQHRRLRTRAPHPGAQRGLRIKMVARHGPRGIRDNPRSPAGSASQGPALPRPHLAGTLEAPHRRGLPVRHWT
jgi:hypothetical protein